MLKPFISLSSLSFSYGKNLILNNISLEIVEGDFIALVGPNGSGKTTLIKIILGLLKPSHGDCILNIPMAKIGYTPQRYHTNKNFPGTVEEILYQSCRSKKNLINDLNEVGARDLFKKKFVNLSDGEQQRVLIALALQREAKLLIFDETTAGVDIQMQQSFYNLLRKLNKKGITIIFITHEVGMISTLVKKIICVNRQTCYLGEIDDIPSMLKDIYGSKFIQ